MPSTPYAKVLVSIDGGAPSSGLITADPGAQCQVSYESTVGWPGTPAPYLEIFAYPEGWDPGAGWLEESVAQPNGGTATVFRYYGATPPPAFTLPNAATWGDVLFALVVGGGKKNGKLSSDVIDEGTMVRVESSSGLWDIPYRGGRQLDPWKKWIAPLQHNLRVLEDFIAGGGGVGVADQPYVVSGSSVDASTPSAIASEAMTGTLGFFSSGLPIKVGRSGTTSADVEVFRLRRTVTDNSGRGSAGTAEHLSFWLPDASLTPVEKKVASIAAELTSTIGPGASLVFRTMGAGTLAAALTLKAGGSLQLHGLDYQADGYRLILDASGNVSASAVTFAEVNAALAAADAAIDVNGQTITGLGTPSADTDAATKGYVDALSQGLDTKDSVRVATTANITLSGTQTVDGVSISSGRVLVKDQSTASQNGFYDANSGGAWTRTADLPAGAGAAGVFCFVQEGTDNHDTGWVCTNNDGSDVVGTDALSFTQFSSSAVSAGDGLTKTGNTIDVVAADGSITVNANSIEASGSFGAKNISQTGATSVTAGSGGFVGVKWDRADAGALTLGGTNATSIAVSGLRITGLLAGNASGHAVEYDQLNAAVSGTTNTLAKFTAAHVVGDSGVTDDGTTVGTTRLVQITKAGIGTTATIGLDLYNSTNSGTQYSPLERWSAWNGGTQVNFGIRWEPQSTSRGKWVFYTGTGSGAPSGSGLTYWDSQDLIFGEGWISNGFYSGTTVAGGSGFRFKHSSNNGGLKYRSSDDAIYLASYNTKPVDIETGADSGGSGGVIRLHIAGNGNGYLRFVPTAPTSSSNATTINLTTSQHSDPVELTEDTTVTITGGSHGQEGTIVFSQGATPRTVTMPTAGTGGVEYEKAVSDLTMTGIVQVTTYVRTLLRYRVLSNGRVYLYGRSVSATIP